MPKYNYLKFEGQFVCIRKFLFDLSNLFFNQIFSVTNGINGWRITNIPQLPYSRGYEFHILSNHKINRTLEVPSHQYIYNIGHTNVQAVINKKKIKINPGDSLYIKPNLKHYFNQKGKLLYIKTRRKNIGW